MLENNNAYTAKDKFSALSDVLWAIEHDFNIVSDKKTLTEVWPNFDHAVYEGKEKEIKDYTVTAVSFYKCPISKDELEYVKELIDAVKKRNTAWDEACNNTLYGKDEAYEKALKDMFVIAKANFSDDSYLLYIEACGQYLEDKKKNEALTLEDYFTESTEMVRNTKGPAAEPKSDNTPLDLSSSTSSSDFSKKDKDKERNKELTLEDYFTESTEMLRNTKGPAAEPKSGNKSSDFPSSTSSGFSKEDESQGRNEGNSTKKKDLGTDEENVQESTSHFKKHYNLYVPLLLATAAEVSAEYIWKKELASTVLANVSFAGFEVLTARNLLDTIAIALVVSASLFKLYQQVCGKDAEVQL
jgi:hypothetical protein